MKLPQLILDMLREKSQLGLNQPSDCEALSIDIERVTGKHIGTNTVNHPCFHPEHCGPILGYSRLGIADGSRQQLQFQVPDFGW